MYKDGDVMWDKEKKKAYNKEYYANNRDKLLEYHRGLNENNKTEKHLWYENNKDRWADYKIEYRTKDNGRYKKQCRKENLKKRYRITQGDYDKLYEEQGGVCAICGKEERHKHRVSGEVINLSIDHDHETGRVRGLLCSSCNLMLGKMNDDISVLESAIMYLERSKL